MRIFSYILLAYLPLLVSCGRQEIKPRTKGGLKLDKGMYIFVGKIVKSGKQVCTCVLMDQRWILALKSCIDKKTLENYRVHFKDGDNEEFIIRKIKKTKGLRGRKTNVILLELSIIIQRKVPIIPVYNNKGKRFDKATKCIAVGFTSNGKDLNTAKLLIQPPPKKCARSTCKNKLLFDTKHGASMCQTDNGAPVFCKVENKWLLKALSFVKKGCQKKNVHSLRISYLGGSIQKAIKEEQEICVKPGCVSAAALVMEKMDKTVDPCDNFYKFACGKWMKMTAIPEGKNTHYVLSETKADVFNVMKYELQLPDQPDQIEAVIKAKQFYESCLDTAKIEANGNAPLYNLMEQLGGLPLLGSESGGGWNSSAYSFEELFVKAFQVTTSLPILGLHVTKITYPNQERFQVIFDQPPLPLDKESYLNRPDDVLLNAYKAYLLDIYQEFGANETTAAELAEQIINLEIDLANISLDNPIADNRIEDVTAINGNSTKVNYKEIVEGIYQLAGLSVNETDKITIISYNYFRTIDSLLTKYPDNVIANYIISMIVMTHVNFLPQVYRDISQKLSKASGRPSRQDYCVEMVIRKMPDVTARIFAKEGFLKSEERYILDLADQLKAVFTKTIENTEWFTIFAKVSSRQKISNMKIEAGHREKIYDDVLLDRIHEKFVVDDESPFKTAISMTESKKLWEVGLLKTNIPPNKPWPMPPLFVNAFHRMNENLVAILTGILQPNVYSHDRPEYMNYGAIGMIIGHEITHGFDGNGRFYDFGGNKWQVWTDEDMRAFNAKSKCFIDMWSNFTVPGTDDLMNNGNLTFNEVLCDYEGAKMSYKAYRNKIEQIRKGKEEKRLPGLPYTPNQLFFLNMAQERISNKNCRYFEFSMQSFCQKISDDYKPYWNQNHEYPVHSTRVNGLMQNSKEFGESWRCPVGSYMNPADKCTFY